jgi:hypothetical protein
LVSAIHGRPKLHANIVLAWLFLPKLDLKKIAKALALDFV